MPLAARAPTAVSAIEEPQIEEPRIEEPQADSPASDTVATLPADSAQAPRQEPGSKPQRQPRYHVVLWNDNEHTFQYVIAMLKQLFGHPAQQGWKLASAVDRQGRVVVLTTTKEHAELKRDQIHAFGADRLIARSQGSMRASIEPET